MQIVESPIPWRNAIRGRDYPRAGVRTQCRVGESGRVQIPAVLGRDALPVAVVYLAPAKGCVLRTDRGIVLAEDNRPGF